MAFELSDDELIEVATWAGEYQSEVYCGDGLEDFFGPVGWSLKQRIEAYRREHIDVPHA
jgi:hypothetical protein